MRSLEDVLVLLPRTRSSLSGKIGAKASHSPPMSPMSLSPPSSSSSSSLKRNSSRRSFLVAVAVAAGVAAGLLFGARDAWLRTGASSRSALVSELVEKLETQSSLLDYALAERDRLARMLGEAQLRASEAQERASGAAAAAAALHSQASRSRAALSEALRERDAAVSEAEAARRARLQQARSAGAGEKERETEDFSLSAIDRHTPWSPSPSRDAADPQLASVLRRVANDRGEVMVALCNRAYASPVSSSEEGSGNTGKNGSGSGGGMLSTWARSAVAAGVSNALVLAMDAETRDVAESFGLAAFLLEEEWRALPAAQLQQREQQRRTKGSNSGGSEKKTKEVVATNHSVSALKFKLLRRILALGYSVLLSDVDVVTLRDPFGFYEEEREEGEEREREEEAFVVGGAEEQERAAAAAAAASGEEQEEHHRRQKRQRQRRRRLPILRPYLRRDSDVEAMSDGWDPATAYGYDDVLDVPAMGWSRYAHSTRVFALNSGLFFVRPTRAADDVLARVAARVAAEPGSWDQAVFNEVALLPSAEGYYAPAPRVRVMAIGEFMNSKVLFSKVRRELGDFVAAASAAAAGESSTKRPSSSLFPPPGFRVPAMVHVNYHPDKHERMKGVLRYFLGGDATALEGFPEGSEW